MIPMAARSKVVRNCSAASCAVSSASKEKFPHRDAKPIVRRAFDAFGPDRFVWGGLGHSMEEFDQQVQLFEEMFDFASETDKAKIRGLNAMKLFGFKTPA